MSAGEEKQLLLSCENESVRAGELCYVRVQYTDENGTLLVQERELVHLKVTGGELIGFGSGNPYNEQSCLDDKALTFFGEALAIIRPDGSSPLCVEAWDMERRTVFSPSADFVYDSLC